MTDKTTGMPPTRGAEREQYGFPSNHIIQDEDGNEMRLGMVDGKAVPPFGEKYFRQIADCPVRDDDIFLCGYPKTGCHWTWEIMSMILAKSDKLTKDGKAALFMELQTNDTMAEAPSPRVLNTHVWFDDLPSQAKAKKSKIVLTTRNPKDTATSYFNHHCNLQRVYGYKGQFKSWFPLYLNGKVDYGGFSNYHLSWHDAITNNPQHPVFVARFENMKEDLPREIRAMAKFLEVSLDEEMVQCIAKAAGFDSMKEAYLKTAPMSSRLLRKGQVGDWKNWLTVTQSEQVDVQIDKALAHTTFRYRYTL